MFKKKGEKSSPKFNLLNEKAENNVQMFKKELELPAPVLPFRPFIGKSLLGEDFWSKALTLHFS